MTIIAPAQQAIDLILHQGLRATKALNPALVPLQHGVKTPIDKQGAIAMYRSKAEMAQSRGTIYTSKAAVFQNYATSTHWTPNIFNYLSYADPQRHYVKGAREQNLSQINTLVVDIDYHDA